MEVQIIRDTHSLQKPSGYEGDTDQIGKCDISKIEEMMATHF